ncbi:MAG: response regulator [Chitinophagaceae bacterium]|nr:response regulator [Chitinophagaceae bacterium]
MSEDIPKLKILIIEDNQEDLLIFNEFLRLSKLPIENIFHSFTLKEALGIIIKNRPDLIIMDLNLPDSNGIPTFNRINNEAPAIPIVVLSGLNDLDTALETIAKGAQDYLLKGEFDEKLLLKTIQYSIERKKNLLKENKKRNLYLENKLKMQKIITNTIIQTQERERKEIGLELHDNINQILASASMCVQMARNGDKNDKMLLENTSNFITKAIEEIRKLTKSLNPSSLRDIGLEVALQELISNMTLNKQLTIHLHHFNKEIENICWTKKLTFYRIAQEQLNNILKHSMATSAEIIFSLEGNIINLLIQDNGIGYDPNKKRSGNGFYNINSRVEAHKGEMQIISSPGKGVILKIAIPHN